MTKFASKLARLALGGVVLSIAAGALLVWVVDRLGRELPEYRGLADYAPPSVTRIHAGDGRLLAEYAREKRVFVPIEAIPQVVRRAFIAAEDQNFYSHPGIDLVGIGGAIVDNIKRLQENRRPRGASTITQQVAKNFLVGAELSLGRKVKEAILSLRLEQTFSKDKILELYLNEIFLGNRSYGIAAAALNYFDKALDELTVGEAAFLAGLPQAPSRYDPTRNPEAATERRNYVLRRMTEDGYVTEAQATEARAAPIQLRQRSDEEYASADFFTEEVRRQLVDRFGEAGFYEGGLSVRTTVDPRIQGIADRSLRRGLATYDRKHGWRGALGRIEPTAADWQQQLAKLDPGFERLDWLLALVREVDGGYVTLGLVDGKAARIAIADLAWARRARPDGPLGPPPKQPREVVSPGDVVLIEELEPGRYGLRQRPRVEGAAVAIDPHTGRVLAMSGGFSYRQSKFNRATQARRQPGSAFKPFVYLAALEAGYTPVSIVLDAPIVIDQGPGLPKWRPENFSEQFYGPSTLRLGLEKSRNVMTVRLAQDIGMDAIIDVARRFGIDTGLQPFLSAALGSNEVTPLALTTAYAMLVNGGHKIEPFLVERIQDRLGKTVFRRDGRACPDCNGIPFEGALPPELVDTRPLVVDPRLAFQTVSMLQGVIERGTGVAAASLKRPLAGKTGTTNDAKDAWFVGFSPDLVVGVFVGYDQPESLGPKETGASVALPIWIEAMRGALTPVAPRPFRTPPGLQLFQVDAVTGTLPGPDTRTVITEAFLPGTEPVRGRSYDAAVGGYTDQRGVAAGAATGTAPGTTGLY